MKILFITNCFPTKKHPEYGVFTKEQIEDVVSTGGIEKTIYFIDGRTNGISAYFKAIPKIRKLAKDADLIHAFHGLTFLITFLAIRKKPIVVSFLNSIENEFDYGKGISTLLIRLTYNLILNPRVYKIFKDKIPVNAGDKSIYMPNGVDLSKFKPVDKSKAKKLLELDVKKRYILFVSSKNIERPQKRYDKFKKVLSRLKAEIPNLEELTLVNEPRERVILYFNAADLHLLTSDFEGSPNSVKESISCNTPVVSTDVGNVLEMLNGIPGCYVSESNSVEELTAYALKALRLESSNNIRERIVEKGLDSQTKSLQLKRIYSDILEINENRIKQMITNQIKFYN